MTKRPRSSGFGEGRQKAIKPPPTNRIRQLAKAKKMTYEQIAAAVDPPAHHVTIAKLASGKRRLTQAWMNRLAKVLDCSPAEIIEAPPTRGLRRVPVISAVQANVWQRTSEEWSPGDRYDIMIPDDPALANATLYAVELCDESMNLRYRPGSWLVVQRISGTSPSAIREGRRYHVRRTRADNAVENSIKTLVKDDKSAWWLKPESTSPEFQEWTRLEDSDGAVTTELIGWVRYAVQRED